MFVNNVFCFHQYCLYFQIIILQRFIGQSQFIYIVYWYMTPEIKYISLFVCLSVCLSVCYFRKLSFSKVCWSICLYVCLSVCMYVCLSVSALAVTVFNGSLRYCTGISVWVTPIHLLFSGEIRLRSRSGSH